MGSSRPPTDRSIGEATFLPQWMKGKLETRFDYSESTFSPPADDTFFYIRYPKYRDDKPTTTTTTTSTGADSKETFRSLSDFLGGAKTTGSDGASGLAGKLLGSTGLQNPADSVGTTGPKVVVANKPSVATAFGQDGKSAIETSGRSIVSVASQIMSFGKFASAESPSTDQVQPAAADPDFKPEQRQRKFSKSLPASPLGTPSGTPDSSPKSRRRGLYPNRFFTGTFAAPEDGQKNGWLLGSILGQSREFATMPLRPDENDDEVAAPPPRPLARKKSISSQNLTYVGKEDSQQQHQQLANLLQARPSELREMNFWSPTSM